MKSNPEHAIVAFFQTYSLENQPILAGFSGGADSSALLLALHTLKFPVTAVHFQHGIRGAEALKEQNWCQEFCAKRDIPFLSIPLHVPDKIRPSETLEEGARRLRLEAWKKLCTPKQRPIFLAHHADDCLEDLFLRLIRGGNSSSLIGLRPLRYLDSLLLCRPLLQLRKADLEEYLRKNGLRNWCVDSSNSENQYRRNALRNLILPEFRRIFETDQGILRTRENLLLDGEYLESLATERLAQLTNLADWRAIPAALLPRVARLWLQKEFGEDLLPSGNFYRRLQKALETFCTESQLLPVDGTHTLRLDQQGLHPWNEKNPAPPVFTWNWRKTPCLQFPDNSCFLAIPDGSIPPDFQGKILAEERFAQHALPEFLTIRHWQPGDRMIPFGATFQKKIQDIFSDQHIPAEQRTSLPFLLAKEKILWIPTVRRAEFGRLQPNTPAVTIAWGLQKNRENILLQKF